MSVLLIENFKPNLAAPPFSWYYLGEKEDCLQDIWHLLLAAIQDAQCQID